ncbi:hypothetical protein [Parafrankia sp. EUN1f]|uniref:hypothetical protein n=1 Tax=Parafrankia sp. EUN1f TaxID=102897 RepID=UPI0001C44DB3|nr:hypothetical protein [Parafrankia sp. EUN1f]EFC84962.1 hypothetical protein FrEUN1fDRAFT_1874 [Parafrankia sp. EUN1f]
MRRYYYRSPFATILRWTLGTGTLILFLTGLQWLFVKALPAILPFTVVGILVVAVVWSLHRLRE